MRILLFEPNSNYEKVGLGYRSVMPDPLGIEYIGAFLQKNGYNDIKIIQQRESKDKILDEIFKFNPDILGISVMTHEFCNAKDFADKIKKKKPKTKIIFGGYHPTAKPEIVEDKNIDYAVLGEGELTFLDLVRTLGDGKDISTVKGMAFYDGSKVIITPPRERIENLDELPFPLRDTKLLRPSFYSLVYPPPSKIKGLAQIIYSRGCPYNCTFCCSPNLWKRKIKFRSPSNVIKEIKQLKENYDVNVLHFSDLNFDLVKEKTMALCNEMIKEKTDIKWYCTANIKNMDQELASTMERAGCSRIGFGIEILNSSSLEKIKPNLFFSERTLEEKLSLVQSSSIISRGFFMIGFPWQTKEELSEMKEKIKKLPLDTIRISIFTPLPGSKDYEEYKAKGLLLHEDFSKYTCEECVIKLENMEPNELYEMREQIIKEFYQCKEYEQRMKDKIKKYPHLKQSYEEFFEFLDKEGVFSKNK